MMCTVVDSANGLAVALPDEVIHRLGLREGSQVEVVFDPDRRQARLAAVDIDAEFARQLDAFMAHYRPALLALAR